MKYYILTAVLLCFPASAFAQRGILDRIGNEVKSQLRSAVQGDFNARFPGSGGGRPTQGDQGPQSFGGVMPGESGRQNEGGGQFGPGGFDDMIFPGMGGGGGSPVQPGFGSQPFPGDQSNFRPQPQPGLSRPYLPNPSSQPQQYFESRPFYPSTSQPVVQPTLSNSSSSDMPRSPVMSNQFVKIRCPQSALGSISYLLASDRGSFRFTMTGGQEQRFRVSTPWTIQYSNGTTQKRYRLEGGKSYTIRRNSDQIWQLYADK